MIGLRLLLIVATILLSGSVAQAQRHFYAGNPDGGALNQWNRRDGYYYIYEFFKINSNDAFYQRRVVYVLDSDPQQRPIVYDDSRGRYVGRWDGRGYSNLPGNKQNPELFQIRSSDWPRPNPRPALPYSPDRYPRAAPPPL